MAENIVDKLIGFHSGSKTDFMKAVEDGNINECDIYHVTETLTYDGIDTDIKNICVGHSIVGDSYNSAYTENLTKPVTNQIGLIRYGMTLGSLMNATGGSISKIIDMMLFTGVQPTVDEFSIISGIVPERIVNGNTSSNINSIVSYINDYAGQQFSQDKYGRFLTITEPVDTIVSIQPDPEESSLQYGSDTGQYTGRVFFAIPENESLTFSITSIVDKVFPQNTYYGSGVLQSFDEYNRELTFDGESYLYKIYIFSVPQYIVTRLFLEYSIEIENNPV